MCYSTYDLRTVLGTIGRIETKVDQVLAKLIHLENLMPAIDDAIAELTTQVKANTDAEDSAITLIQELATLIQNNANDPAAIRDLAAKLKGSADALGAAVTANTPAA